MAQQGGISGVAVGMATAGAFLLWIGIQGVNVRDGLKSVTGGKLPKAPARSKEATDAAAAAIAAGITAGQAGASAGAAGIGIAAGAAGTSNAKLVTAARTFLGVLYRWGGMSRDGIDCSGLVVRSFQAAYDVTPPRTTYTQIGWKSLTKIDSSLMSPGDICFWPRVGPPSHVAIATGAGTVIHAPRPGKVVAEVPVRQAFTGGAMPVVYRYTGSKG